MNKNITIWNDIIAYLEKTISIDEIKKWINPLELVEISSNSVTIAAPNKFYKDWVEDKYLDAIKEAFKENFINAEIHIIDKNIQIVRKPVIQKIEVETNNLDKITYGLPLNKNQTFDSFVAGKSNDFAYSICVSISDNITNPLHNPLYIYGDVGLGKTHLMQAVGNQLQEKYPKLNILYTTADSFADEYIDALNTKRVRAFEDIYRNADILLFDDVQNLVGKQRTAETFFTNFNFLQAKEKRIIITSNVPPNKLPDLDKRLTSRFSSGLTVDIQPPSLEEKEAIIYKHLQFIGEKIPANTISFLAENIKTKSTRELLGVITTLIAKSHFDKKAITIEYASETVKHALIKRDRMLSPDEILDIVTSYFHLKLVDLKSSKRSQDIAYPRSIAMYILREKTELSLTAIGEYFNRNHSTVMSAIEKINSSLESDGELKGTIDHLLNLIKNDIS